MIFPIKEMTTPPVKIHWWKNHIIGKDISFHTFNDLISFPNKQMTFRICTTKIIKVICYTLRLAS
ncbi:MAG TPA: hypothetical protein VJI98_03490 [Candidatus Nanoarchaeia archaeon]|nr:hypothetical protein [Candidatus Nanoarchaeia archaeon]